MSGDKPSFASSSRAVEYADVPDCVDWLESQDVFEVTGESHGPVSGVSWPFLGESCGGKGLVVGCFKLLSIGGTEGVLDPMESECEDAKLRNDGVEDVFLLTSPSEFARGGREPLEPSGELWKKERLVSASLDGVGVRSPDSRINAFPTLAIRMHGRSV